MNETAKYGLKFLDFDNEAAGILAYSVDGGEINEADAAPIWQRFEKAQAAGTKIRIYAEMSAIPSVSGGLIVEKLKHLGSILTALECMAIVGDAGWMGIYAKIVDPITKFDVKHFTLEQRDEAIAWIRR
jgi:hypothetical protein